MPTSQTKPTDTVCVGSTERKTENGTATENMKPGYVLKPSVGTYGNGWALATAYYGESGEAKIAVSEVMPVHPESSTPYDISTNAAAGDSIWVDRNYNNGEYILRCSGTYSAGDTLAVKGGGILYRQAVADKDQHVFEAVNASTTDNEHWQFVFYRGISSRDV